MKNDELYKKALKAIEELFEDTSVSQDMTLEKLEELQDEIKNMIDALKYVQS